MAATFDQMSHGRLDVNIVPGGIQGDFEQLGERSEHAARVQQDVLDVWPPSHQGHNPIGQKFCIGEVQRPVHPQEQH